MDVIINKGSGGGSLISIIYSNLQSPISHHHDEGFPFMLSLPLGAVPPLLRQCSRVSGSKWYFINLFIVSFVAVEI